MIRIRSKRPGFRRCGIAHPAEWTEYPDDLFTDEQLERLKAESMLQVEWVMEVNVGGQQDNDQPSADGGQLTEAGESVESVDSVDSVDSVNETDRTDGTDRIDQRLEDLTKAELIAMLEEKGVTDISPKVRKDQLIKMLRTTEDGGPKTV